MLQLGAYACCGLIIFLAGLVAIFYLFSKYSESSSSYKDKKRVKTDDNVGRYSSDDIGFEEEKTTGKDVSFFDKILGKKKICDECGSELIYKKNYDSYYCPECRTFK